MRKKNTSDIGQDSHDPESFVSGDTIPMTGRRDSSDDEIAGLLRERRVIVVEDEGITQLFLRRTLAQSGLQVVGAASNGLTGIEIALRERPDIILMDIKMPGPVDGLEAAMRILQNFRTCLIMLSAYPEHCKKAEEIGAAGYILKPIDARSLIVEVHAAFSEFNARQVSVTRH